MEREAALDAIENERLANPLLLNETFDKMSPQMSVSNLGGNLELGMYICQATGAFPYTNVRFRWNEILRTIPSLDATSQVWSPLTNAFGQLRFKFLEQVNPKFVSTTRKEGRLESFRAYLRKVWNTVGGEPDPAKAEPLARDFRDELTQRFQEAKADWDAIDREHLKWGIPTIAGAVASGVGSVVTSGTMSLGIPAAGFTQLVLASLFRQQ